MEMKRHCRGPRRGVGYRTPVGRKKSQAECDKEVLWEQGPPSVSITARGWEGGEYSAGHRAVPCHPQHGSLEHPAQRTLGGNWSAVPIRSRTGQGLSLVPHCVHESSHSAWDKIITQETCEESARASLPARG